MAIRDTDLKPTILSTLSPTVALVDADATLAASASGNVYSNRDATGIRALTLPNAVVGMRFKFYRESQVYALKVIPTYPEEINNGGVRGYYYWELRSPGWVELVCNRTGEWSITGFTGDGGFPLYENTTYYISTTGNDSAAGGSGTPRLTILGGLKLCRPGDTLVLKNGTYTGSSNEITAPILLRGAAAYANPPAGLTDVYQKNLWVTIKGETYGSVFITSLLDIDPGYVDVNNYDYSLLDSTKFYVQFDGIVWNAATTKSIKGRYLKFFNCAFRGGPAGGTGTSADNGSTVHIGGGNKYYRGAQNVLMEDCCSFGPGGRYKFAAYNCDSVIFRRCVVRWDQGWDNGASPTMGAADYVIYDSSNSECQNCISIDSLVPSVGPAAYAGAYRFESNYFVSENVALRGCMAINNPSTGVYIAGLTTASVSVPTDSGTIKGRNGFKNIEIEHFYGCVLGSATWAHGIYNISSHDVRIRNATIALLNHSSGFGFASEDKGRWVRGWTVEDSIFCSAVGNEFYSYSGWATVNPGLYDAGTAVADALAAGLKYGVRVEPSSTLDTAEKGATILVKYGQSGALPGDPGAHQLGNFTGDDLWPWPNEGTIKTLMTYATFGSGPADRDWTAGGLTLTQYIWRKLGAATGPP